MTEKEALALKEALVKFQPIIEGEEIMAITDHSALTWSRTYQNINRRLTTYGATFAGFNEKLKIVHRAGRVHSNVDPLSRLRRRIPFYDAPHYNNDPQIELNSSQVLDYYEKYREKVESMTHRILTMDKSRWLDSTIELKDIPVPYQTTTQMETQAYAHPEAIQEIVQGYEKDPHFSEVLTASGTITKGFSQYTV